MKSALIGSTGFVGGTLLSKDVFDYEFNSKNISSIRGRSFNRIVCAGVNAKKWVANQNPEADWHCIESLMSNLNSVRADRFILISTIDVYISPIGVDENTVLDSIAGEPYGRHRLLFEKFIKEKFDIVNIIRLPALVGIGLKKNIIFDMLNNNMLERINPNSTFQWYDITSLADDIKKVEKLGLDIVNLMTEPITVRAIQQKIFPGLLIGSDPSKEVHYDVKTIHSELFGGQNGYIYDNHVALDRISQVVAKLRKINK